MLKHNNKEPRPNKPINTVKFFCTSTLEIIAIANLFTIFKNALNWYYLIYYFVLFHLKK